MRLIVQSPSRPERIIAALEDIVPDDTSEIRLSVAYVTQRGTDLFIERLFEKLGDTKWKRVKKRLLTCFDYGITEPEALKTWCALPRSAVFVQNAELVSGNNLYPAIAFHAKMFEFRAGALANFMVGSANLTERALTFNSEAATVHTGLSNLKSLDASWKRLCYGSRPADASLIKAYEAVQSKQLPHPTPSVPVPGSIPAQSLWDAMASGECDPVKHEYFWVDAGYLSGGSHSQLELPRGANRYFGFDFEDYPPTQVPIGVVNVSLQAAIYNGRPFSWHGDNKMERINLPTGFSYSGVMLFRRRESVFQLLAASSGSQRALAWANASETAGRRYRVGQKGERRCGLF